MSFFSRLSDIVSCKLDDLIAEQEDPPAAMSRIISEIEEGLAGAKRSVTAAGKSEERLKAELEQRLLDRDEEWEWAEIVRGLDNLQEVEAVFQGRRFILRSQLMGQAHKAIRAAGVAVPPTIREA